MNASMRTFTTGATRDLDESKLDFDGFLSPYALERFARYMDKHRDTANGRRASDDWQKGIPVEVYRKSAWRHFFDCWRLGRQDATGPEMEEALCALLFNIQGWLHELVRR